MKATDVNFIIKAILDKVPSAVPVKSDFSQSVCDLHIPGVGFIGVSEPYDNLDDYVSFDDRRYDMAASFVSEDMVTRNMTLREFMEENDVRSVEQFSAVHFLRSTVTSSFHSGGEYQSIAKDGTITAQIYKKNTVAIASTQINGSAYAAVLMGEGPVDIGGATVSDKNEVEDSLSEIEPLFEVDKIIAMVEQGVISQELGDTLVGISDELSADESMEPS